MSNEKKKARISEKCSFRKEEKVNFFENIFPNGNISVQMGMIYAQMKEN